MFSVISEPVAQDRKLDQFRSYDSAASGRRHPGKGRRRRCIEDLEAVKEMLRHDNMRRNDDNGQSTGQRRRHGKRGTKLSVSTQEPWHASQSTRGSPKNMSDAMTAWQADPSTEVVHWELVIKAGKRNALMIERVTQDNPNVRAWAHRKRAVGKRAGTARSHRVVEIPTAHGSQRTPAVPSLTQDTGGGEGFCAKPHERVLGREPNHKRQATKMCPSGWMVRRRWGRTTEAPKARSAPGSQAAQRT